MILAKALFAVSLVEIPFLIGYTFECCVIY